MFTRAVELTSKPGKSKELAKAINEKAVPILKSRAPLPLKTHAKSESHVSCKMRDPGRIRVSLGLNPPDPHWIVRRPEGVPEFNHPCTIAV